MGTRKPEIPPEADMDGSEEGDKGRDDRIDKHGDRHVLLFVWGRGGFILHSRCSVRKTEMFLFIYLDRRRYNIGN